MFGLRLIYLKGNGTIPRIQLKSRGLVLFSLKRVLSVRPGFEMTYVGTIIVPKTTCITIETNFWEV